jgi:hypothetical protein
MIQTWRVGRPVLINLSVLKWRVQKDKQKSIHPTFVTDTCTVKCTVVVQVIHAKFENFREKVRKLFAKS